MSTSILERLKGIDLERLLRLKPPYPPVALQLDRGQLSLVRFKAARGKKVPQLESVQSVPLSEDAVPASMFDPVPAAVDLVRGAAEQLFGSAPKPGRISLVIPDNLAKISLITLPERPASRRQADELVEAQMRRAVPFKLEEAKIAYQVLPGEGRGVAILVALMRRALVEQYENALEAAGVRVGLIDLCTPNLLNLCRSKLLEASRDGDVTVLNCAARYVSLAIVRSERLIFFRCKTLPPGTEPHDSGGVVAREIHNSFSYYEDKLSGKGIASAFVRSVGPSIDDVAARLAEFGVERCNRIDPFEGLDRSSAGDLDEARLQLLAPAIGAAVGRWGA